MLAWAVLLVGVLALALTCKGSVVVLVLSGVDEMLVRAQVFTGVPAWALICKGIQW